MNNVYYARLLASLTSRHSVSNTTLLSLADRCIAAEDPVAYLSALKRALDACPVLKNDFGMFDNYLILKCFERGDFGFLRIDGKGSIEMATLFLESGFISGEIESRILSSYLTKTNKTPLDGIAISTIHPEIKRQFMALC